VKDSYLFFGDVRTPPTETQPVLSVGYPKPYATAEDEATVIALFIIAFEADDNRESNIVGAVTRDDVALPSMIEVTIISDTVPFVLYNSILYLFFYSKRNLTHINIK
jgi:hypothetical protein